MSLLEGVTEHLIGYQMCSMADRASLFFVFQLSKHSGFHCCLDLLTRLLMNKRRISKPLDLSDFFKVLSIKLGIHPEKGI